MQKEHTELIHKNLPSLVTKAIDMPVMYSIKISQLCKAVAEQNPQVSLVILYVYIYYIYIIYVLYIK